jgi:hypothetical protein
MNSPMMREYLDQVVGCSNAPQLIAVLRRKGLSIPCELVERFDKDGNICRPGRYSLTYEDRQIVNEWIRA